VPAYAVTWGWTNFLALCDVAATLTCLGLLTRNRLLISSQILPALMVGALWTIDVGARLVLGRHVFGGTEYMWLPTAPLAVRLLSLFHLALPVVLLLLLRRLGYDRRALALQTALTAVLLVLGRFLAPAAKNLNYAFRDPLFKQVFGPWPLHLAGVLLGIVVLVYLPTHLLLRRLYPDVSK
jgi:hypothetical protein